MVAKDFEGVPEGKYPSSSNGYLLCGNCHGYYKLKSGESPDDFESCECGGPLEYQEKLPKISKENYNDSEPLDDVYEDYTEVEQLLTLLKSKSEKRKALINNLSNRIQIQEGLLNEIKEERWTLWDVLNQRNLQDDIKSQKRLLDDITENEDRLMSVIKEQRQRAQSSESILNNYFKKIGMRGFLILEFVAIIVLLILVLA